MYRYRATALIAFSTVSVRDRETDMVAQFGAMSPEHAALIAQVINLEHAPLILELLEKVDQFTMRSVEYPNDGSREAMEREDDTD